MNKSSCAPVVKALAEAMQRLDRKIALQCSFSSPRDSDATVGAGSVVKEVV